MASLEQACYACPGRMQLRGATVPVVLVGAVGPKAQEDVLHPWTWHGPIWARPWGQGWGSCSSADHRPWPLLPSSGHMKHGRSWLC